VIVNVLTLLPPPPDEREADPIEATSLVGQTSEPLGCPGTSDAWVRLWAAPYRRVWMVAAVDQGNYQHGEAAARTAHHGTSTENRDGIDSTRASPQPIDLSRFTPEEREITSAASSRPSRAKPSSAPLTIPIRGLRSPRCPTPEHGLGIPDRTRLGVSQSAEAAAGLRLTSPLSRTPSALPYGGAAARLGTARPWSLAISMTAAQK
jgi:hypothetical protein